MDLKPCIDIIFITIVLFLFLFIDIFYFNRTIRKTKYENYNNIAIHLLIVPFFIIIFFKLFTEQRTDYVLGLFTIPSYIFLDFIVKSYFYRKINLNQLKWKLLRLIYFSLFFIMQVTIWAYFWYYENILGFIMLLLVNINSIIFIIYLKKYEKRDFKNLERELNITDNDEKSEQIEKKDI